MPDITMCASDSCHRRTECYRNAASGTEPNPYRQAYFISTEIEKDNCEYFSPQTSRRDRLKQEAALDRMAQNAQELGLK